MIKLKRPGVTVVDMQFSIDRIPVDDVNKPHYVTTTAQDNYSVDEVMEAVRKRWVNPHTEYEKQLRALSDGQLNETFMVEWTRKPQQLERVKAIRRETEWRAFRETILHWDEL